MKKKVFCNWLCNSIFELQMTLATHCIYTSWVLTDKLHELQNCNSPYVGCNSLQFIATQLQFSQNNSLSTTIQFHYNYTHDVILTSLIVIHLLKSNMWYYEDFWRSIFSFGKESCNDEGRTIKTHWRVLRRPKFLFTLTLLIQSSKNKWPSYAIGFKLMLRILEEQQVQLHTQYRKTNDIMCNLFLPVFTKDQSLVIT
jgi:hypothetical protein